METDFTLYAYTFRSRAERVIWTLGELGITSCNIVRLDPFQGETFTAEFMQLNPQRKVPVLVHGDQVLTESLAIMEYLNAQAGGNLVPQHALGIYRFRHLVSYIMSEIEAYLWIADQALHLASLYHWPPGTGEEALARVQKSIHHLHEELVKSTFAVGEDFSLADIYACHILAWASGYGIAIPEQVAAYQRRMEARPAFPLNMKTT